MTGYTAKLAEEGQSFNEFVMTCARAFGPLIEMKDLPLDAPIPDKFDGGVSYHKESLVEAQEELKRLQRMSDKEREAYGKLQQKQSVASLEESIKQSSAEYQRVADMEKQVSAWHPPAAYNGLKTFMLSQLAGTKSNPDYLIRTLSETRAQKPLEYWDAAVECALRDISYHKQAGVEAKKSVEKSLKWVRNLQRLLNS